jgi:hypothetical protein
MESPATGFLHIVRIGGDIDPVNAVYRIAFAPVDGSLRTRRPQREGFDSLTDFLRFDLSGQRRSDTALPIPKWRPAQWEQPSD